jgi:hypothetical protein
MKATTYKALDNVEGLVAGLTYDIAVLGRFIQFTDRVGGKTMSLYKHEFDHAVAKGMLVAVDGTQSQAMSCSAVVSLCHQLPSRYIY